MEAEPRLESAQTPEGLHDLFIGQVREEEKHALKALLPHYTGELLPPLV